MLRLDISPKFRAHREPAGEPDPASQLVRDTRERARRLARLRGISLAIPFAIAAPFFAFNASMIARAPSNEPSPNLVAKAPAMPPATIAQAPSHELLTRGGVDFTATSATCSATARDGEPSQCAPARRKDAVEANAAKKSVGARATKSAKNAKNAKNAKAAKGSKNAAGVKDKKAAAAGARG